MDKKQKKAGMNGDTLLLSQNSPFSVQEAYKSLRTNVAFSIAGGDSKCIGVTSPNRGDGKSSVAVNLAISFAQIGKKVVLVDCDMRLPTVAHKLGIKRRPGLSDYLVGEKSINECIFSVSKLGFAVVPAGNIPPDPTTLLESKEMRELLGVLRNYYDYIIVDLPPVLPVPDAMILSKHIDGYLIVVKSGTAEYRNVSDALKQLQFADSNIIGFVYNGKPLPSKRSRKYRYNYTYYKKKWATAMLVIETLSRQGSVDAG